MALDPAKIGFRPMEVSDLPLFCRWVRTPHVAEWWAESQLSYEQIAEQYGGYVLGKEPVEPFLILYGAQPIGYIQAYRIADFPDYSRLIGLDEEAVGIDLLIGDPEYVHRGLGARLIARFLREQVFAHDAIASCVIGPEPKNTAAIRAYEKVGFRYLKTIQVPEEPEPEYIMRLDRETFGAD